MTESGRAATRARICSLDFCNNKHYSRGYCRPHYEQVQRGQTPRPVAEYTDEVSECAAPDCPNTFHQRSRGSRRLHCSRTCKDRVAKREARAGGWVPAHKRPGQPRCKVDGCDEARFSWDMCVMHYTRAKAHGAPGEAAPRKARKGESEWRMNGDGYLVRSAGVSGQIELQHRVVMEEHIGRALWPDETVHHKHGVRHDNRIEKLELWSTAQPAGQRVTDKLEWAREIIARYADLPPEVIE